jgi:methyl-accepting chemotaxis protein
LAARAGRAGKGFAIVANEVKELAKQTAQATEGIGQRVSAIQADTQKAVTATGKILTTLQQVTDISSTIASAVEEQKATTDEIERNVGEAYRGSAEIAQLLSEKEPVLHRACRAAGENRRQESSLMATELVGGGGQFGASDAWRPMCRRS